MLSFNTDVKLKCSFNFLEICVFNYLLLLSDVITFSHPVTRNSGGSNVSKLSLFFDISRIISKTKKRNFEATLRDLLSPLITPAAI